MSVSAVNAATTTGGIYDTYGVQDPEKKDSAKTEETAGAAEQKAETAAAVYEKSDDSKNKATYSINKMSAEDRASVVKQLKADQESRKQSMIDLMHRLMGKQAGAYAKAGGSFKVDAATQAQAQKDISEDGYWGVKQTSQRLFDFASALAGDDVNKMKEMQAAIEKGFKKATAAWGGDLPGICHETLAATNKLFDDYYSSKASA